jgi:radical SAM family RiPP maturation amino acid epimerase
LARIQSDVFTEGALTLSPLFAFELSMGCSAQCWFCGLDPPPLQGWFPYSEKHSSLWRDLLNTSWEIFGAGCRSAVCYHATEPTDNPDYLHFLRDFHEIFGSFPQTTTSRPLKDITWTRELFAMQAGCEGTVDRFSVMTPQSLHKIHEAFTPEELLNVRMVIQNEVTLGKAMSGRTIDRTDVSPAKSSTGSAALKDSCAGLQQMTIECTCGYLVNMVEQSIKLISPCNASPRWPLGYEVHAEGTFQDATEFKTFILKSIETCMPAHLGPNDRLAFRPGLTYEKHDDGFSLISRYRHHDLRGNLHFVKLGELLLKGDSTTREVTDTLINEGMPIFSVVSWLDKIYQGGLLDESLHVSVDSVTGDVPLRNH